MSGIVLKYFLYINTFGLQTRPTGGKKFGPKTNTKPGEGGQGLILGHLTPGNEPKHNLLQLDWTWKREIL